jgi:type IV secretion system protein VirB6
LSLYIRPENFVDDLLHVIDELTAGFVEKGFTKIVSAGISSGLFVSVFTFYVIYFLYKVEHEKIPYEDCTKHLLKSLFVLTLSTNWDMFHRLIYQVFTTYPTHVSGLLLEVVSEISGYSSDITLGSAFTKGMNQAFATFSSIGLSFRTAVLCFIGGLLILLGTFFFTMAALVIMVIAKLTLAIYLVLAPYYIWMYLFDGTRGLSESWLKHTLGSALVPLFVGVTLAFVVLLADLSIVNISNSGNLFHDYALSDGGSHAPSFSGIFVYFCCSVCSIGIIWLSTSMAASLTSSLTQSTLGGGRAAMAMGSAAKGKYDQRKYQRQKDKGKSSTNNQAQKSRLKSMVQKRVADRARSAAIRQATMNKRRRMA